MGQALARAKAAVEIAPGSARENHEKLRSLCHELPIYIPNISVWSAAMENLGDADTSGLSRGPFPLSALPAPLPPTRLVSASRRGSSIESDRLQIIEPVVSGDHEVQGYLVAEIRADRLSELITVRELRHETSILLLDSELVSIAEHPDRGRSGKLTSFRMETKEKSEDDLVELSADGRRTLQAAMEDVPEIGWFVAVARPKRTGVLLIEEELLWPTGIVIIGLLSSICGAWFVGSAVRRRLTALLDSQSRLLAGGGAQKTHLESPREFANVSENWNEILDRWAEVHASRAQLSAVKATLEESLASLPVRRISLDGRIEYFSEASERLFGYKSGEVIGQSFRRFFTPEDLARDLPQQILDALIQHGRYDGEGWRVRADGSRFWAQCTSVAVRDSSGKPIAAVGVIRDITHQSRDAQRDKASQRLEAMGRLAGGVAHDFNNILTTIQGFADLAQAGLSTSDPNYAHIEEIRRASDRASSLTRQLLAFSRRPSAEKRLVEVNSLIRHLESMLRRVVGEDVHLVTQLGRDAGLVFVDPGRLEHVLLVLVMHLREAMPEGGLVRIESGGDAAPANAADPSLHAVLTISGSGPGMQSDVLARRIRTDGTADEQEGAESPILQRLRESVVDLGGILEVHAEAGRSAQFTVRVPKAASGPRTQAAPAPEAPREDAVILLVEDDDVVRRLAQLALSRQGYTVIAAHSGQEALDLFARERGAIHLLLSDAVLPDMSGMDLAERLTAEHPGLRVLFISGYTDESAARRGVVLSSYAYLQKPFSLDQLKMKVRSVLHSERNR
ncbi:MAG: response regulator [Planctomycetes bacterium]|nr:response regulator [Planctomycetota bacterium]